MLLFASLWFSVLGRGVTSANFQVVGNLHVSLEVLIIDMIAARIGARQSFKMEMEILSIPGLCLMALMILCVRSHHCLWYSN